MLYSSNKSRSENRRGLSRFCGVLGAKWDCPLLRDGSRIGSAAATDNADRFLMIDRHQRAIASAESPRNTTPTKKADVVERPKAFHHVGLLANEPPGTGPSCSLPSHPMTLTRMSIFASTQSQPNRLNPTTLALERKGILFGIMTSPRQESRLFLGPYSRHCVRSLPSQKAWRARDWWQFALEFAAESLTMQARKPVGRFQ